jgi:hypothetical protein
MADTTKQLAQSTAYNAVKLDGILCTPTTTQVTATLVSAFGNVSRGFGATVPTDGEAGYTTGCFFTLTTGVLGGTSFINEGSNTACAFRAYSTGGVMRPSSSAAIPATATATAAQVATGYITSTSAAATVITLPTGTLLGAALGATAGTVFNLIVDNTAGANTVTMAVAVNGVLSDGAVTSGAVAFGDLTIASGVTGLARFTLMFSSATAYAFSRTA